MSHGKWVVILGANSDVAKGVARSFAAGGYSIVLASRIIKDCQSLAEDLTIRYGISTRQLVFDATNYSGHQEFFDNLGDEIEGVFLTFGVMSDQVDAQNSFELTHQMIDTNYTGCVSVLEIIARILEVRKSGFIVAISSVAGDRGRKSNYIYGSTKAALTSYLEGLRHRLSKSGVDVLTVKPGFIATKMTRHLELPKKLTASPAEVGDAIFKAVKSKKDIIYVKPIWRLIMGVIVRVPNYIFHKTNL